MTATTEELAMYQDDYVDVYDLVMRHRGRDYAGEARQIVAAVRARHPSARRLLDVACGTGLHLRELAAEFPEAHALDASADMLALARRRVPGLRTHHGDMRDLDGAGLGSGFDVVTCMFAVPHLACPAELDAFVAAAVRRTGPSGVLVLEPWYAPEQFLPGYVSRDLVTEGDRTVVRLSHSRPLPDDRVGIVVHYAEADPDRGIRHRTQSSTLTLFRPEHFRAAFAAAGCRAEHVMSEPFTWGVWVAQRT